MPKARSRLGELQGNLAVVCYLFSDPDHSGGHFFAAGHILENEKFISLDPHRQADQGAMSIYHQGMPDL